MYFVDRVDKQSRRTRWLLHLEEFVRRTTCRRAGCTLILFCAPPVWLSFTKNTNETAKLHPRKTARCRLILGAAPRPPAFLFSATTYTLFPCPCPLHLGHFYHHSRSFTFSHRYLLSDGVSSGRRPACLVFFLSSEAMAASHPDKRAKQANGRSLRTGPSLQGLHAFVSCLAKVRRPGHSVPVRSK